MTKYRTILADPPWDLKVTGSYLKTRKFRPASLVYPTMTHLELCNMPISDLAETGCHLWLWATNQSLRSAFKVMEAWGFKYHTLLTWVKPSGLGNYFISRTEHILFGYKGKCIFNKARYQPNVYHWPRAGKHSRKPLESYDLIESISDSPRLELFARPPVRVGWDVFGNEVQSDIHFNRGVSDDHGSIGSGSRVTRAVD